jgi:hypothetical protein
LKITDRIQALENGNGLKRSINIDGDKQNIIIRIAQASSIKSIGNGLFIAGDHQYFISIDPSMNAKVENYLGQQVLLVPASASIAYTIIW